MAWGAFTSPSTSCPTAHPRSIPHSMMPTAGHRDESVFQHCDPTYGSTTNLSDALGRATQITEQDGSIKSVAYDVVALSGPRVIACKQPMKRQAAPRLSDGLGRLVEVDEPNPGPPRPTRRPRSASAAANSQSASRRLWLRLCRHWRSKKVISKVALIRRRPGSLFVTPPMTREQFPSRLGLRPRALILATAAPQKPQWPRTWLRLFTMTQPARRTARFHPPTQAVWC